jgi:GTP cyclohydrolase I
MTHYAYLIIGGGMAAAAAVGGIRDVDPHSSIGAHHLCTQMRGVREIVPLTRTTFWRGEYASNPALRAEFLTLCGVHQ